MAAARGGMVSGRTRTHVGRAMGGLLEVRARAPIGSQVCRVLTLLSITNYLRYCTEA